MKTIRLSDGRLTMVDDEDFERLSKHPWCVGANRYAMRYTRKRDVGERRLVYMHRDVMRSALETNPKLEIDHIDGNPLNNQKSNLRVCTRGQNSCNQGLSVKNQSGFKGVTWIKPDGNWRARIKINRKFITLGRFSTAKEAAMAYNEASKIYHGEFGRLNSFL